MMAKGTVKNNVIIHRTADERIKRTLVTMVMYSSECFMAIYRSTFISARRNSDAIASTLITLLDNTISKQYALEVFPSIIDATHATIERGCPITPIIPSVVAKQAIAMLDMV